MRDVMWDVCHLVNPAPRGRQHARGPCVASWQSGLCAPLTPLARPTGTFIIGGTDEIQMILDDQIVKIQAMNASPFVKPFKERASNWETILQTLQVSLGSMSAIVPPGRHVQLSWVGALTCITLNPAMCAFSPVYLAGHAGQLAAVPVYLAVPGAHLQQ